MKFLSRKIFISISLIFIGLFLLIISLDGLVNINSRYSANIRIPLSLGETSDWVERRFETFGSDPYILWAHTTFKGKQSSPYISQFNGVFEIEILNGDRSIYFDKEYGPARMQNGDVDELIRREFLFKSFYPQENFFRIRVSRPDPAFSDTVTNFSFERGDKGLGAVSYGIFSGALLFLSLILIIIGLVFVIKSFKRK